MELLGVVIGGGILYFLSKLFKVKYDYLSVLVPMCVAVFASIFVREQFGVENRFIQFSISFVCFIVARFLCLSYKERKR